MAPAAGNGNSVTVAELGRRFDRFEGEVKASFVALHEQLRDLAFVDKGEYALQLRLDETLRNEIRNEYGQRLTALEQWKTDTERSAEEKRQRTWTSWVAPIITTVAAALIIAFILSGGAS